jgi:rSAM/selenodomain-associated transferase 1
MTGDQLLIFARVPRLGTVKRRLARGIGARAALRFYQGQLAVLLGKVARDRRWATALSATPDGLRARWPRPVPVLRQGRGDLGQRMARAMRPYRRVVLVGSDIPYVNAADIAAAFRALGRADSVFGPAEDGGYWLVGFGPRRPADPFGRVRWSTRHALADTLVNFRNHRVALLRRLRDVDTAEDFRALKGTRR